MSWTLDGRTAVLAIIGDPIAQVKAPQPLTELLQAQGLNAVLVPLQVPAPQVQPLLDVLLQLPNFAGFIVTVPHKQLVAALPMRKTRAATEADAVNVVRRIGGQWEGDLTDGTGFLSGLRAAAFDVRGKNVHIAGAGGAGNAIAFALAAAGAAAIGVHDVDAGRKAALVQRLQAHGYPAREWTGDTGADLLVNATPLGMSAHDPLPIPAAAIDPGCTVAEVIMEPKTTALLAAAQARGAQVVYGRGMLDHQLADMVRFFGEAIRALPGAGHP